MIPGENFQPPAANNQIKLDLSIHDFSGKPILKEYGYVTPCMLYRVTM